MDNLGPIVGPLPGARAGLLFSVRTAILVSVIPGLLAALAIVYAIRQAKLPEVTERKSSASRSTPSYAESSGGSWPTSRPPGRRRRRDPADPAPTC